MGIADEKIPGILAGSLDGLVADPDPSTELVATQVVPDVLHWVEFGGIRLPWPRQLFPILHSLADQVAPTLAAYWRV